MKAQVSFIVAFSVTILIKYVTPTCTIPVDDDCYYYYTEAGKIPDPFNCQNFYECYNRVLVQPTPYYCGDHMYFDVDLADCVEEAVFGHCTDACIVRHQCNPNDCTNPTVTSFPDLDDCNTYYVCSPDGDPLTTTCNDITDKYFDGEGCTSEESQCCINTMCSPYCGYGSSVPFMNVPDPCDCHSYYLCETEDSTPAFKGTCPNNEVFDGNGCNSTANCAPYCNDDQCAKTKTISL